MAPAAGNYTGEAHQNTVYLTTSLDTRLVTTVSGSDTVSDFKERIMLEHRQCFPAIGNIEIHSFKVKRRGVFYQLSDSMLVKSAFGTTKGNCFLLADASSLEQDINIQHFYKHKVGDPIALPWVTHSRSINGHHNHEPLSIQPKTIPYVNQILSNVDGDSCKDGSKNIEEDRSSVDKQLAINKEIISKKRARDVSKESLLKDPSGCELPVKKKRKTQKVKIKASEENTVSTYDDDKGKDGGIGLNSEKSFELKSKDNDLIGENARVNNGEKHYDDKVDADVSSGLEGVERITVADVPMVAEKNIQHGMCEKKKENEVVQKVVTGNEMPSSSTRISDCERDATGLNVVGPLDGGSTHCIKPKGAEKEVSSTFFIEKLQNINKDAIDSSQQDVGSNGQDSQGDLIDKYKEDREFSLKQRPEVKLPERRKKVKKSAAKKKKESSLMHADENPVGDISSTVLAPILDEKIIGEKNEALETTLIDDSKKNDEMIVNEMEVSEPTNSFRNRAHVEDTGEKSKNNLKDIVGSRKRKKDVEKIASKLDKPNDVATSADALHVDCVKNDDVLMNRDVELYKTEKNLSQVHVEDINDKSEKQNGKMDGVKKDKKKKKTKKSASRNEDNVKEGEISLPDVDIEDAKLFNEGLVRKAKKNNESSLTDPQDQLSKDQSTEVELGSKVNHHLEDASKNVTAYEDSKVNNEVDIANDGSHEINFLDHFAPGHQPNETASIDNAKDAKKPKKKKKNDSKNDGDIQSQKIISKDEGLVGKVKKNNESSLTGPQVRLSKDQSTEVELESKENHLEDTSKNVSAYEFSKVNNEVDITNDGSHEVNFLDHFAPGHQPNETASIDNAKDAKKPKKKKKNDSKNDGDIQSQKIISKDEGLVGKVEKNNESSLTGPQVQLSKDQSTEVELELKENHLEDTSKNVTAYEFSKVNNEVDITNDGSHEVNILDHFAPGHQPNETASIDNAKDAKKPKKKKNDSKNDGDIQSQKIISKDEGLVGKVEKNNESSLTGPQVRLSKDQSTEVELESKENHVEDTSKNVTAYEFSKVNNEVDITNDGSHEVNFLDHFAPGHQPNETASIDNAKDAKKPKKKKKNDSKNDGDIQSQKIISKDEGLVGKVEKNNESSLTGPQVRLSKDQSNEVELESKENHLEDTSKNVTAYEFSKVNNEVDITNDGSHEVNFLVHFAPGHQPEKTASIDNGKDAKKPKKKIKIYSMHDGDKIISKSEGLVGKAKKNNKSTLAGPQDGLSKHQSTEVELESRKSESIDHHHHLLEDTSNNVTVSEVSKGNNKVDIRNDGSHEINFLDQFAPGRQPNKLVSIDNGKDAKKPKKITTDDFRNDDGTHLQKAISKFENNNVVTDPNIPNTNQIKISRKTSNIDSESSSSSKSFGRTSRYQKSNKQQSVVGPVKNVLPVVNSLLNRPGKIFGDDDSDRSSADDNATVNSDSSTRKSTSSSGESASSIDLRKNRSHAKKIKEGGGKKSVTSQNVSKKVSMTDLLRNSSRFKKAKFSASQLEDTESQPVDIVPDSQPFR